MSAILRFFLLLAVFAGQAAPGDRERLELPAKGRNDLILNYHGFTICYDEADRIPRWAAYELTAAKTEGDAVRGGLNFRPDERVAAVQPDNADYRGSGWSRGHMVPAGDCKWDEQAMRDSFFYTNCCPQDERLNNGSWNVLENRVRSWARQYGSVYVVTGPLPGRNRHGRIGAHGVLVPDAFFKALLVHAEDGWHAVAFVMQNESDPQKLPDCLLSVRELERISGIDFFPQLPDAVERRVERNAEPLFWGLPAAEGGKAVQAR